jgi:uncharacterized protein YcbK (DUF882 family)
MFGRRELLQLGLAAGVTTAAGLPVSALAAPLEPRRVAIHNLHTGEALNAIYWENGKYVPDALSCLL